MKYTLNAFRILSAAALLFFILLSTGCITATTTTIGPKTPGNGVLYVARLDAILSTSDVIKVSLNETEIGELTMDSFMVLHLVPGEYQLQYLIYNKEGTQKNTLNASGTIKPDKINSHTVVFNFGWKCWAKFDKGGNLGRKLNFLGEFDMTEKISPK